MSCSSVFSRMRIHTRVTQVENVVVVVVVAGYLTPQIDGDEAARETIIDHLVVPISTPKHTHTHTHTHTHRGLQAPPGAGLSRGHYHC